MNSVTEPQKLSCKELAELVTTYRNYLEHKVLKENFGSSFARFYAETWGS
jgi:hypothetical protein